MGPGTVSLAGSRGGALGESCTGRNQARACPPAPSADPRDRGRRRTAREFRSFVAGRDGLPIRDVSVRRPLSRGPAEDAPTPSIAPPRASPLDPTGALPNGVKIRGQIE